MYLDLLLFFIGFIFLIKGADFFVDGASSIAKKFKISNLVIGLTVVAFGTSLPEFLISAISSFQGSANLAIGNVIGSNITNTLLILGIGAIITPIVVKKNTISNEIPFSVLAVLSVVFLANDFLLDNASTSSITRADGLTLLLFFSIFIYYTFGLSKVKRTIVDSLERDNISKYSNLYSASIIILGMLGLFVGGKWIVDGVSSIAALLGFSDKFIALTFVSIGTSLPELATSVSAARKNKVDMALGNIIGSNIFNLLLVLGGSATIMPIYYSLSMNTDMFILFGISVLLLVLVFAGKKNMLAKWEGYILLSSYFAYIAFLFYRG